MSQQKTQPRVWAIELDDDFDAFRQEVQAAMLEIEAIGARLGGKFYLEPKRQQDDAGLWHTTSWVIVWDSFVPGKRAAKTEQQAEVIPLDTEDAVAA